MRSAEGRVHVRGEVRPHGRAARSAEPARLRRAHPRDDPHALPRHGRGALPRTHRDGARRRRDRAVARVRHEEDRLQEEGRPRSACRGARGRRARVPQHDRAEPAHHAKERGHDGRRGAEDVVEAAPLRLPRRAPAREALPRVAVLRAARGVPPPQARVLPRERSARPRVRERRAADEARHVPRHRGTDGDRQIRGGESLRTAGRAPRGAGGRRQDEGRGRARAPDVADREGIRRGVRERRARGAGGASGLPAAKGRRRPRSSAALPGGEARCGGKDCG